MAEAIPLWLHIVAVTAWVGPQFFLFVATGPALRAIDDPQVRLRAMRLITNRFGWLGWTAMAVIVLTGIFNILDETEESPVVFDGDFRYLWIFITKMALLALTVLLTALHTFVIGPQQLRLHEEMRSESPQGARLRRTSLALSTLALLASLAVIFAATLLADHEFSFQPV